jgi:hypothetical protein
MLPALPWQKSTTGASVPAGTNHPYSSILGVVIRALLECRPMSAGVAVSAPGMFGK